MRCKICGDYFQSENELQTICGEHTTTETPSPQTLASKEELNEIARALQDLWSVVKPEPRPSPFDAVWREYAAEIRRVVLKNTPPQEHLRGALRAAEEEFNRISCEGVTETRSVSDALDRAKAFADRGAIACRRALTTEGQP